MHRWSQEINERLAGLNLSPVREAEIVEELSQHLEDRYQALVAGGATGEEAHRLALEELSEENLLAGGLRQVEQRIMQDPIVPGAGDGTGLVSSIWQDVRYASRVLRKTPGFTSVAVLTLALGIGVNTTIFSFVSSILLRKPPVPEPDRLMMLRSKNPEGVWAADRSPVSAPDFLDWRAQSTSFAGMAAASFDDFTLSGDFEPERLPGAQVSPDYFSVLRVAPILGRAFAVKEDQAGRARVVMLSERVWQRRFAADPQVVGRTVKVNGESYTVVGIVPRRFQLWSFPAEVWVPLVFTPSQLGSEGRKTRSLSVMARLRPGVSEEQAQAEMATLAGRLAASHPETNKGWGAGVKSLQGYSIEDANVRTALVFLMATVGFVLLIACANLANLLLARNSGRRREFAIRTALGAGRARLARQLLSECMLLSLTGGSLGLLFAYFGAQLIRAKMNWNEYAFEMGQTISMDWRVLLFTLAVSVAAALIFGLAPALQVSRPDLNASLKDNARTTTAGRERHRLQNLLVAGELALSVILLVGAGLLVKSFIEELGSSVGMNPRNILTATVSLSGPDYQQPSKQVAFFQEVLRQLQSSSQVESAAVTTDLPVTFPGEVRFAVEGQPAPAPDERPAAGYYAVSPNYLETIRTPLLAGRGFTASDNSHAAPVVIVDAAFAHKYFASQNPVGRHIRLGDAASPWSEIVGVANEVSEFIGQNGPRPHIFAPFLARPDGTMRLVVRTRTEPASFAASLRRAVWAVDKDQAVTDVQSMERVVHDSGQGDDLMAEMMGTFAAIALTMAAIGIYGLLAYLVGQRTHEIGVRMALGARPGEVLALIMRGATFLALSGVAVGFLISLGLPHLFAASFTGYRVRSGWVLAGTPLAVILVAVVSCYIPARRATKVDPMVALRYE
jgi:putative ABC transport system permease protein